MVSDSAESARPPFTAAYLASRAGAARAGLTAANGLPGPALIILGGMTKPFLTVFTTADYARIRALGDE